MNPIRQENAINGEDQRLIAAVRKQFLAYYAAASRADAALMDDLAVARHAVIVMMNTRRLNLPKPIRNRFEKTADAVDQLFTHFREAVRSSRTFAGLRAEERKEIERTVFDL